jgi:uncharacterized membrane protein (DUF485 family)
MGNDADILRDPEFQKMLAQRSRWRWGLSGGLIGLYFAYCLAGIYFADVFARPVFGSSIPWGIALAYLIIALAVFLSILYIRVVGRLLETPFGNRKSSQ